MVYKNDFVAVLKVNGKILREDKDTIFLPFGSEYCILMKNLNSRKAVVKVSIDGQDVLNGHQLIIDANSELELERFLDNLDEGNRFKFIEKTQKIQNYRGDKVDDGIIRIEYRFEKETYKLNLWNTPFYTTPIYNQHWSHNFSGNYTSSDDVRIKSISFNNSIADNCSNNYDDSNMTSKLSMSSNLDSNNVTVPKNDEGITVKGSKSDQQFKIGNIGDLEDNSHVIIFRLKGVNSMGNQITQPVTVKTKKICETCGTTNKSINKYCRECGTYLN